MTARPAPERPTARPRPHPSIVPDHLSEAVSVAILVLTVAGMALVITGVAMVVMALTISGRYAAVEPPPDLATLGVGPLLGGLGLLILGTALVGGSLAVLTQVRGARRATGVVSGAAAALSAAGVIIAMTRPPPDPVLATALAIATLIFGVAGILLVRPAR